MEPSLGMQQEVLTILTLFRYANRHHRWHGLFPLASLAFLTGALPLYRYALY